MRFKFEEIVHRFQTAHVSDASKQFLRHFGKHQLVPNNARTFAFKERYSEIGQLTIYYIEFSGGVELRDYETRGNFLLHLPLTHYVEIQDEMTWHRISPRGGFMLAPDVMPNFRFPEGGEVLVLKIDADTMEQRARTLIQHTPQQPLRFEIRDFSEQAVAHLKQMVEVFFRQIDELSEQPLNSLWLRLRDEFLLSEILLGVQNSYTELLHETPDKIMPRVIRLAREYMETHINEPISVADLCAEVEASPRSLNYTFKRFCQTTPMRYLLDLRLTHIRKELLNSGSSASITDITMKWGITHQGRFARHYQNRFGELPSQTLAR